MGCRSCFHQVRESKDDAGPSQGRIGFSVFLVTVSISFALGQARCGLCAVIGFGAAYGAGRLMRLGWLQFFFKPEDAVQLLDWFTLIVDPAGRMPFYFTTFRR